MFYKQQNPPDFSLFGIDEETKENINESHNNKRQSNDNIIHIEIYSKRAEYEECGSKNHL